MEGESALVNQVTALEERIAALEATPPGTGLGAPDYDSGWVSVDT